MEGSCIRTIKHKALLYYLKTFPREIKKDEKTFGSDTTMTNNITVFLCIVYLLLSKHDEL